MIEPISGSGRNVTLDNWFSSLPLCYKLLGDHRLSMAGTLKKNNREIPCSFLDTNGRPAGSLLFGFRDGFTKVSYQGI